MLWIRNSLPAIPIASLVDTKETFEKNSPGGFIGKEPILEHVHPDLRGYALMSDAFIRH